MRFCFVLQTLMSGFMAASLVMASDSGLDVTLSQVNNTRIKAVVKNVGKEEVTFSHLNFFGDAAPVKKVAVFRNDTEIEFQGIRRRVKTHNLSEDALTTLAPGATFEDEFDTASTCDLTKGGSVTISSSGIVSTVKNSSFNGHIPFTSNKLTIDVDAAAAALVTKAVRLLNRRTMLTDCLGSRLPTMMTALSNTVSLANAAAEAATSGSASRFLEYFKTNSSEARSTVAARLSAVANEANSTSSGRTSYYCADLFGYCSPNVLAYTIPSYNIIANCDIYYTALSALTGSCHAQDQATTSLHEFTHAPGVYSPGTEDYAYGYEAATALNASQALLNADTYALFANAVYLNC
ncbi:Deuterolysin metalloprotease family-domain-containing protein [Aspergillus alliaceus]|uniref:Neutral protease 2 n=1 Tax=Petromyces alliaceus TaxID=209559 RepID=A0A5N6FN45_PETAA|nr:Deuterolysin metalloprotease family-domain-containing protein [Aspergillus alliaceus]KAB8231396.1 Deuterolysin metalloprotease family-domain-containing protein [Aspergillus alliaceus]KAE8388185.1 Deuterolysin metalloprotease family-domain-containing protein [Aspergillus alliaceus]